LENKAPVIDLHIHTTASDGTCSPAEILHMAQEIGLLAVSITDHDTLAGVSAALASSAPPGIQFLTGVEISTRPPDAFRTGRSLHILGYGLRLDHPDLNQALETLQAARKNRNPEIISRLNQLGLDITLADVARVCEKGQIGRPHIAQALMHKGYVESLDQAFDRFIGNGKPAYVDKYRIPCAQAMDLIIRAGGIPVLAHPGLLKYENPAACEALITTLMESGLRGIEAYYPEHSPEQTAHFSNLAKKHRLVTTGGTDFHGAIRPGIAMGTGSGHFHVPESILPDLLKALGMA